MKTTDDGEKFFTADDLPKLKRAYNKAVKEEKDIFLYEGNEIVTDYAKYLIEYMKLNKKR